MQIALRSAIAIAAEYSPTPTMIPMPEAAHNEAAVIKPLTLKPSFMITPAHKNPMPVRIP